MSNSARNFFTPDQLEEIKEAILNAELDTSGEIRVHIENNCPGDVMVRAARVFKTLKMSETKLRNGVLIYLAIRNRKFAILGDSGIHAVVGENYWEHIKVHMLDQFREGRFTEGLAEAILDTGKQLKQFFPHDKDDINELPDDVSFGKD